jgi:hypothetical protein
MKIDDVPAGRELDALVAEKVMGWVSHDWFWTTPDSRQVDFPEILKHDDRDDSDGLPHYSTAIKVAWEVIRKMMETSGDAPLRFADEIELECEVRNYWDNEIASYLVLKNLTPEIICRAALKAVDVTEEPD